MALLGVQPQLVQMPPTKSRSTTATRAPNCDRRTAQVWPAGPAPITIAVYFDILAPSLKDGSPTGLYGSSFLCRDAPVVRLPARAIDVRRVTDPSLRKGTYSKDTPFPCREGGRGDRFSPNVTNAGCIVSWTTSTRSPTSRSS